MHVKWTGLRDEWAMGVDDRVRERQTDTERTLAKGKACCPRGAGAVGDVRCSSLLIGSVSKICSGNCSLLLIVFYSFVEEQS